MATLLLLPMRLAAGDYASELVARAHELNLAQHPQWQALLHYRPRVLLAGVESFVDDPKFFLAADGKTNPEAELEATLRSFFAEPTETAEGAQCRRVARFRWLNQLLGFDPSRLRPQPCSRFEAWRAQFGQRPGVTLVFASAYLNNPASLFGHTLLRIEAQPTQPQLLSFAVNYAADTSDPVGLVFAFKGVTGGYPGRFSGGPYHRKVTEYADLENRDLWEYRLDLEPAETERLLEHLWELFPVYFDYYFFDENCSFHLLGLLEVARPTLALTSQFRYWTVPADTVRAVADTGMVQHVAYRPARASELRHAQRVLSSNDVELARDMAVGHVAAVDERVRTLPASEQARVLELAVQIADYQRLAGQRRKEELPFIPNARVDALLLARSGVDAPGLPPVPNPVTRPEAGQRSARIALGAGAIDGRAFEEIRFRPGYRDLLDAGIANERGTRVEVLDLRFRHTHGDGAQLERATLVDLMSVQARDALLKPIAWHVGAAFERRTLPAGNRPLVFSLDGGAGLSFELRPGMLFYGLAEVEAEIEPGLDQGFAVGIGPSVGWLFDPTRDWRINLSARAISFDLGDNHQRSEVVLGQRLTLDRDQALRLEIGRTREFGKALSFGMLTWSAYF